MFICLEMKSVDLQEHCSLNITLTDLTSDIWLGTQALALILLNLALLRSLV